MCLVMLLRHSSVKALPTSRGCRKGWLKWTLLLPLSVLSTNTFIPSHNIETKFSVVPQSFCALCLVVYQQRLLLLLLSRFSRVQLLATPWTAAYQAPTSMGFSRQEYWSGCHWLCKQSVRHCVTRSESHPS